MAATPKIDVAAGQGQLRSAKNITLFTPVTLSFTSLRTTTPAYGGHPQNLSKLMKKKNPAQPKTSKNREICITKGLALQNLVESLNKMTATPKFGGDGGQVQ